MLQDQRGGRKMVQVLEPKESVFGRIGKGIGQGLSEQLPKEMERGRLAQGLEQLSQQGNLTPFERFSKLSSLPGITPQMIQSGSELLRQQGIAEGFRNAGQQGQEDKNVNPFTQALAQQEKGEPKSITTAQPVKATIENYIPRSREQLVSRAGQLYDQNPQLYPNPELAMQAAVQEDQQNQSINAAQQQQRKGQQDVQNNVRQELQNYKEKAGAEIPDNIYNEIENQAIDDVRSGERTELEAAKHYRDELDKISRQYKSLETIGNTDFIVRDTKDIKQKLKIVRNGFKERNDLENLADNYISKNGLSPGKAYYLAYPPSEIKELNNALSKLPEIPRKGPHLGGQVDPEVSREKTLKIAPQLAKALGQEGSPLAVAEVLNSLGYDKSAWIEYLDKNRKKLNLGERQGRELEKPSNVFPTLNDNFLFWSSGLDKLVER